MNIWRMKLRAGEAAKGGDNMWPACKERGIASYTHSPIYNTDLTNLEKSDVVQAVKGGARSSIFKFAWDINGGDVIYVGDAQTHEIVARGTVTGEPGKRAYRYNAGNAISPPNSADTPWRHEVPVDWDEDFLPFGYTDPAPQTAVFLLKTPYDETRDGQIDTSREVRGGTSDALRNELAYQRETPASKKMIERLHDSLSNLFRLWVERRFAANAKQEKNRIDLTFTHSAKRNLAELKICYCSETRHAIREAVGQLFEYNYYPSNEEADYWWLVLDCEPSLTDRKYISVLIDKYRIPLTIAWPNGDDFKAYPSLPFDA
jgi:hypothetical protein